MDFFNRNKHGNVQIASPLSTIKYLWHNIGHCFSQGPQQQNLWLEAALLGGWRKIPSIQRLISFLGKHCTAYCTACDTVRDQPTLLIWVSSIVATFHCKVKSLWPSWIVVDFRSSWWMSSLSSCHKSHLTSLQNFPSNQWCIFNAPQYMLVKLYDPC